MQSTAMSSGIFWWNLPRFQCDLRYRHLYRDLCGSRIYDRKFGILWRWPMRSLFSSLFQIGHHRSLVHNPPARHFPLYCFILYHWKRNGFDKPGLKKKPLFYVLWSGIFMGLAVLTKGQVALMVFLLVLASPGLQPVPLLFRLGACAPFPADRRYGDRHLVWL